MTDEDHQILQAAALDARGRTMVADQLGISPTRLHQRLLQLVETREAAETYPVLVGRHRRLTEVRRWARSSRRLG